jgi:hypothetical protein
MLVQKEAKKQAAFSFGEAWPFSSDAMCNERHQ